MVILLLSVFPCRPAILTGGGITAARVLGDTPSAALAHLVRVRYPQPARALNAGDEEREPVEHGSWAVLPASRTHGG